MVNKGSVINEYLYIIIYVYADMCARDKFETV